MAAVDLYGGDAERIRNQYRTSLGRDASDDEVSGWLSGSYGGGSLDQRLNQISGSHEAQQRQAPITVGQNPNTYQPQPAQDDPWARARSGIESTYLNATGRAAAPGDADKWLSGQFGYGSGLQDYDKFIQAIMGSPEARSYRPPTTIPEGGYQSLDYWQQRGVPNIDIFDPMTGQLKAGWQRTKLGYERTGGAPQTNVQGPQGGNFQQWFSQLTQGKAPTPETLESLAPILSQYGIRLGSKGNRGWTDTIILPDGRTFDVIEAAGIGTGKGWVFNQNGGPGYIPTQGPGDQFNDPYTQFWEQVLKGRFGNLGGPMNDPFRQMLMAQYQQRANQLGNALEPEYQRLSQQLQGRVTDLRGPGYTGAENEVLRTQALDPIENDRTAAKKRVTEQLAARGITLDSGIAQQALMEVDKAFDGMRATSQTTLAATDLQRRESRNQRADTLAGTMYDLSQGRAREQLDVMQAMEILEGAMRGDDDARQREQMSIAGALADLGPQRMQLAMQAAGMGGNPSSLFANMMQLAQMNQQSQLINQNRSSQLWSGLGSIAAILANAGR